MKKLVVYLAIAATFSACNSSEQKKEAMTFKYPETKLLPHVDTINGVAVRDDYRWLEDDMSPETAAWVDEQIASTQNYLAQIPHREKLKQRITDLINYEKYSAPFKMGEYYIYEKNDGLQNQFVCYIQKGLDGKEEVLLNPNTMSEDGTVSVNLAGASKDNKYLAYTLQRAGSDWQEIYVLDIENKKTLSDKLEWVKFSGASWYKNGFFYNRFDKPKGSALAEVNEYQKVYYHVLGTSQEQDQLIYEDKKVKQMYYGVYASEDERYWFLSKSQGTGNADLYVWDKQNSKQKTWKQITFNFSNQTDVVDTDGDNLFLITNDGAPNNKLVKVNINHLEKENWETIIPERAEYIDGISTAGKNLFVRFLKDVTTQIEQYDYAGKLIRKIELPDIGTAFGFNGKKEDKDIFYSFTSFMYPPTIFRYNMETGKSEVFRTSNVKFNKDDYETKQILFTSKDGTRVPMFIVCKKGIELNGKNPTLMYGYGGFKIVLNPSFSPSRIAFLEQGGIYVMVNLRGGQEYGEKWHEGGMLLNKQNVFDDFISAGEYLIREKYTSPDYLAIQGGSNGGLLVGACMTQRPELFKVAIPQVGVMDMMRFHKFTVGFGWIDDYGDPDEEKFTKYIHGYSPYHNIKDGVKYPATLITTGDHDDRVVPAHSFKFGARLQAASDKSSPAFLYIEKQAGHGAGKPLSKTIEEIADIYSFIFYNMNVEVK